MATTLKQQQHTPRHLRQEEINNPLLVIDRFFDYANIHVHRKNMWEWIKITVSGTYSTNLLSKEQRYDITYLYEHITRLIEAAHLIHLKQSKPRKQKQKKKH
jgi:hypothetical protein